VNRDVGVGVAAACGVGVGVAAGTEVGVGVTVGVGDETALVGTDVEVGTEIVGVGVIVITGVEILGCELETTPKTLFFLTAAVYEGVKNEGISKENTTKTITINPLFFIIFVFIPLIILTIKNPSRIPEKDNKLLLGKINKYSFLTLTVAAQP
jgi:hypothetical protein